MARLWLIFSELAFVVILKKWLIVIKYNQSTLITNSSIYEKNHHVIVITFVFNI